MVVAPVVLDHIGLPTPVHSPHVGGHGVCVSWPSCGLYRASIVRRISTNGLPSFSSFIASRAMSRQTVHV